MQPMDGFRLNQPQESCNPAWCDSLVFSSLISAHQHRAGFTDSSLQQLQLKNLPVTASFEFDAIVLDIIDQKDSPKHQASYILLKATSSYTIFEGHCKVSQET